MIVLSLFDGMACGYEALKRAGIPVTKYYASEIDKYAMQVANKNHPDIVQLGNVENWRTWDIEKPDLIIGGSPCQGFSFAGKQLAFDDPRSKLFFTMMDIIKHYQPRFKMLENVKMKKEHMGVITQHMGVEPMFINSSLVSAQNRQRYYWFNWEVGMPGDKGIKTKDILDVYDFSVNSVGWQNWWLRNKDFQINKKYSCLANLQEKAICMTARQVASWNGNIIKHSLGIRFINTIEAERLQTLPDGYTAGVSKHKPWRLISTKKRCRASSITLVIF